MAQNFNDREINKFKKEIADILEAIEQLRETDVVRLNSDRLKMIVEAKVKVKAIETHFDESQI